MLFKFLSFILLFSLLFSCQKQSVSAEKAVSMPAASIVVFNVKRDQMLELVNNVRQSGCTCGTTVMPPVAAISWNDQLSQAAYDHSKDMMAQNYFSHTARDGSNAGMRITKAGYVWRSYGENIALGYTSEQSVMEGWIKSEGHCKNIMSANFKEMGAGREGGYWTQEFGSK